MVSKCLPTSARLEKNTNDLLTTGWTEVIIVTCFYMKACCKSLQVYIIVKYLCKIVDYFQCTEHSQIWMKQL